MVDLQVDVVDVRADGLSDDDIAQIVEKFPAKAINKASTTWRGLDEAARQGAPVDLIEANPTLMKRPLFVDDGTMVLGWDVSARAALGVN